ncbi:hypothetical protein [Lysobacter gummosus]|uniref:hypothetical protein n=1 Tax=Lysobacter gummosus TaxID=262324 RepID=UPI00363613CC
MASPTGAASWAQAAGAINALAMARLKPWRRRCWLMLSFTSVFSPIRLVRAPVPNPLRAACAQAVASPPPPLSLRSLPPAACAPRPAGRASWSKREAASAARSGRIPRDSRRPRRRIPAASMPHMRTAAVEASSPVMAHSL